MGKKFLTGIAFGSIAGLAAWASLDEKQQQQIKTKVSDSVYTAMDVVTDYTLNALDIADAMLHDYGDSAANKVNDFKDVVNDQKEKFTSHFVSDDFDEQTADIREALENSKNDDNDDIIIDQTTNK
ncbi:hypothetical protein [uncultured Limosilactobacillus sp.]|uniref:hypothetical protein n=1 Tax=uncultured Limosilactobacillus sp. TaxID=2837629 RepID=UPI0025D2E5CA|nr:hypothetical protein [uncultured Limosilactobacillus sp.]